MLKLVIFIAIFASASAVERNQMEAEPRNSTKAHDATREIDFEKFETKFAKKYANEGERLYRKSQFERTREYVMSKNSNSSNTYTLGLNPWSDKSRDELKAHRLGLLRRSNKPLHPSSGGFEMMISKRRRKRQLPSSVLNNFNDSLDWREKGALSPVKDQGLCAASWAFASTATLESRNFIKNGNKIENLSDQQLVDCSLINGNLGCNGGLTSASYHVFELYCSNISGLATWAYEYVIEFGGLNKMSTYQYESETKTCRATSAERLTTILGYVVGYNISETTAIKYLQQGPLTVAISVAANDDLFDYESGIFKCHKQAGYSDLDHVVSLVGYTPDYWILRNSWSEFWGENGYFRIARQTGDPCGVLLEVSAPIVA